MLSHSIMSNSLWPHGLKPDRLLCPWTFSGKNSAVGCHFLLHRIFPNQELSPCLQHWQVDSLPLCHLGSPILYPTYIYIYIYLVTQTVKNLPAMQETGLTPGLGRSPGEGNGYLFQYSCLENPMNRGAWWVTVHGVANSDTTRRLSLFTYIYIPS